MQATIRTHLALLTTLWAVAAPALASRPLGPCPRAVYWPCSLQKLCAELSRRSGQKVFVEPRLAELRVAWSYTSETSLPTVLARLAELLHGRVESFPSQGGGRRFVLSRDERVAQWEEAWQTGSLSRRFQELLRACDADEHGTLDPTAYSPGIRGYLEHLRRGPMLRPLRHLDPDQMARLWQGEKIRFAPGAIPEREIRATVAARYASMPPGESPKALQESVDAEVQDACRNGVSLRLNRARKGGSCYLMLDLGRTSDIYLCAFGDEELGLPLTHSNPYLLLETGSAGTALPATSSSLDRRLRQPVAPARPEWEPAIAEFARIAGVDLVSDAYLCRDNSRPPEAGAKRVLVRAGATVAEALETLCRQYGYLWWEKEGCVYLRARAWPWDLAYEVPDAFLERWSAALEHRRAVGPAEIGLLATLTPLQRHGLGALVDPALQLMGPGREDLEGFFQLWRDCGPKEQEALLGPGLLLPPAAVSSLLGPPLQLPPEILARFPDLPGYFRGGTPERPLWVRLGQEVLWDAPGEHPLRRKDAVPWARPEGPEPGPPSVPAGFAVHFTLAVKDWVERPFCVTIPRLPDPFALSSNDP